MRLLHRSVDVGIDMLASPTRRCVLKEEDAGLGLLNLRWREASSGASRELEGEILKHKLQAAV